MTETEDQVFLRFIMDFLLGGGEEQGDEEWVAICGYLLDITNSDYDINIQ
jgi:hypothetical protein